MSAASGSAAAPVAADSPATPVSVPSAATPTPARRPRLLVVSNRLPFTVKLVKTNAAPASAAAAAAAAAAGKPKAGSTVVDGSANVPFSPPADATSMQAGATPFAAAASSQQLPQPSPVAPFPSPSPSPPPGGGVTTEVLISPSPGGLVSALRGVDAPMTWIGWPGLVSDTLSSHEKQLIRDKFKEHDCLPVFLGAKLFDLYYNGFSNNLLWPLFHYIPLNVENLATEPEQFAAYEAANVEFARAVLDVYKEGDTVWVHDFQLMLLPALLRSVRPTMRIGFFLHIPFPSSEIYRALPARRALLHGVLASDLIGFHTHDYCRHFQSACQRIIGATCQNDTVRIAPTIMHSPSTIGSEFWAGGSGSSGGIASRFASLGANASLGTYPIGIDPHRFLSALESPSVQALVAELRQKFGSRKIIIGVDRLDYIKGILHKLYSMERFFETHPEWIGKVVLIQIAVPSRTDVPDYQRLREKAHELVGRINGRFGNLLVVPLHYLDTSLSFSYLVSLYRVADAILITSMRDGMNLVAYEYIASQQHKNGVLILSEFAGAAQSLGAGAIQVNPWSFAELSEAIHQALLLTPEERATRFAYVFKHVMTHTSAAWSKSFLEGLDHAAEAHHHSILSDAEHAAEGDHHHGHGSAHGAHHLHHASIIPPMLPFDATLRHFGAARKRLVVLGLAGTLSSDRWGRSTTPAASKSPTASSGDDGSETARAQHRQQQAALSPLDGLDDFSHTRNDADCHEHLSREFEQLIATLANDAATTVVVLTSRSRAVLDELLGMHPSLWLSAENGAFLRKGRVHLLHGDQAGAGLAHGNIVSIDASTDAHSPSPSGSVALSPLRVAILSGGGGLSPSLSSSAAPAHVAPNPWLTLYAHTDLMSWKESVRHVMEHFSSRTPNSFIVDSETHVSWHYSQADPGFARRQVNDLITHLTGGPLSNTATEVLDNSGIVQVRPLGVSKGYALRTVLNLLYKRARGVAKRRRLSRRRSRGSALPPSVSFSDEHSLHATIDGSTAEDDTELEEHAHDAEDDHLGTPHAALLSPPGVGSSGPSGMLSAPAADSIESILSGCGIDFVLCLGNFLERDEDVFTLLNVAQRHGVGANGSGKASSAAGTGTHTPRSHRGAPASPSLSATASPGRISSLSSDRSHSGTTPTTTPSQQPDLALRPAPVMLPPRVAGVPPRHSATSPQGSSILHASVPLPTAVPSAVVAPAASPVKSPTAASASASGAASASSTAAVQGSPVAVSSAQTPALPTWASLSLQTLQRPAPPSHALFGNAGLKLLHEQLSHYSAVPSGGAGSEHDQAAQIAAHDASEEDAAQLVLDACFPARPSVQTPTIITCSVGRKVSRARFHLPDRRNVHDLLQALADSTTQAHHNLLSPQAEEEDEA